MITLIIGPMFSGKTTELLRQVNRHRIAGRKCCLIKYDDDNRYDKSLVVTHDNRCQKGIDTYVEGKEISAYYNDYDVIGVDEGQFFNLRKWLDRMGDDKIIIIAGLNGTSNRTMFSSISDAIPICDEIISINAICTSCGKNAIYSKRLVQDSQEELIGGAESYTASCRKCL